MITMESDAKLPERMRGLFWSYDFDKIDPLRDADIIISGAISHGDLEDWRWVKQKYGESGVARMIKSFPATQFRPQVLKLASLLFHFKVNGHSYASKYA